MNAFEQEVRDNIRRLEGAAELHEISRAWVEATAPYRYTYNFSWLGRPMIQFPQDVMAMQELIWQIQPDLIVETGIAHGGSLIFYSSMLELLGGDRGVVGVDIEIRHHNRTAIEAHPMFKRIIMIEGSSIDQGVVRQVFDLAARRERVLVVLDSNHTHDHVLQELRLYSPLVRNGSYLVVFDTIVEDLPDEFFSDRPWKRGDNPKTAVWQFVKENDRFEIDRSIQAKLLLTVAPDGYLRCTKD